MLTHRLTHWKRSAKEFYSFIISLYYNRVQTRVSFPEDANGEGWLADWPKKMVEAGINISDYWSFGLVRGITTEEGGDDSASYE